MAFRFARLWAWLIPGKIDYDEAKKILESHSISMRMELAGREDAPPETLYYLATDEFEEVRARVAANKSTPARANALICDDEAVGVRQELARKISRLLPDLSGKEVANLREQAIQILERLAEDRAVVVRRIIAEEIKRSDLVPVSVARKLARDLDILVAGPVLEYSPLLSSADLIEIIAGAHAEGALTAIANRADVDEDVAQAIVTTVDIPAVASLLANPNAQIREETLDRIVRKAESIKDWHKPLVFRTHISQRLILRISRFVSRTLLDSLLQRSDIEAEIKKEISSQVERRLEDLPMNEEPDLVIENVRRLDNQGKLNDSAIVRIAQEGDRRAVVEVLALVSGMPRELIIKIISAQSGNTVVALCWRAGLAMRTAHAIQSGLGFPLSRIVPPREKTDYPFSAEDMNWNLELFGIPPKSGDN